LTIHVVGTGKGTINGRVVDATNGSAIAGANVKLDNTSFNTQTDSSGSYTFNNVSSGTYTITASKSGYITISSDVTVFDNQTTISNIALPSSAYPSDIVITLTWGDRPYDIDSHLWLPAANPYHIFFGNRGSLDSFPYVQLDVDDVTSFGPENVTVRQQYMGRYVYAIYNYSGSPELITSKAKVTVVKNGVIVNTFLVPTTGSGRWWYVFDYDVATGSIIPRNYITSTTPAPYSTIRDDYGGK